jgi:hypothetical protein
LKEMSRKSVSKGGAKHAKAGLRYTAFCMLVIVGRGRCVIKVQCAVQTPMATVELCTVPRIS